MPPWNPLIVSNCLSCLGVLVGIGLRSPRERGDGGRRNVEARVGPEGDDAREYFLGDVRRELLRERRRERLRVRLLVGLEAADRLISLQ